MEYGERIKQCYFKDKSHRTKFNQLMDKITTYNSRINNDPQYLVSAYILASLDKSFDKYINNDGIDFPEILNHTGTWTNSEVSMAHLACTLFNGYIDVGINRLFQSLDEDNHNIAMSAINFIYKPNQLFSLDYGFIRGASYYGKK